MIAPDVLVHEQVVMPPDLDAIEAQGGFGHIHLDKPEPSIVLESVSLHAHHIETKDGHSCCSPDCPEHGHRHHHGSHEEAAHRIEQKKHVCGPDCPEHGAPTHHGHKHYNETTMAQLNNVHEVARRVRTAQVNDQESTSHKVSIEHVQRRQFEENQLQTAPRANDSTEVVIDRRQHPTIQQESIATNIQQKKVRVPIRNAAASKAGIIARSDSEDHLQIATIEETGERRLTQEIAEVADIMGARLTDQKWEVTIIPDADEEMGVVDAINIGEIITEDPSQEHVATEVNEPMFYEDQQEKSIRQSESASSLGVAEIGLAILPRSPLDEVDAALHQDLQHGQAVAHQEAVILSDNSNEAVRQIAEIVDERCEVHKVLLNLEQLRPKDQLFTHQEKVEELTRLLTILGFESPERALQAYIRQYGAGLVDQLLIRLLELLNKDKALESPIIPKTPLMQRVADRAYLLLGRVALALVHSGNRLAAIEN